MSRKDDPEFIKLLKKHVKLDESTGLIRLEDLYANLCVNVGWKGNIIVVPYSHVVWLLTYGRWPREGFHLDHKNNNPLDNRPSNLQEITEAENQKKRRGRKVYRNYGTGKYGYGLYIFNDKRDGRFYITRTMSRGHGKGDLKGIKVSLGGFDTLLEAERKVKTIIAEIKANGLDYIPDHVTKNYSKATSALLEAMPRIREMRRKGYTLQAIADATGFSLTSIYNKTKGTSP